MTGDQSALDHHEIFSASASEYGIGPRRVTPEAVSGTISDLVTDRHRSISNGRHGIARPGRKEVEVLVVT